MEYFSSPVIAERLDQIMQLYGRREINSLHMVRILGVVLRNLIDVANKVLLMIRYILYLLVESISFLVSKLFTFVLRRREQVDTAID